MKITLSLFLFSAVFAAVDGALRAPGGKEITFWKCLSDRAVSIEDSRTACTCTQTRTVWQNYGEIVAIEVGEYTSEHECNKRCGREPGDACYLCVTSYQGFPIPLPKRQCMHRADSSANPNAVLVPQGPKCCPLEPVSVDESHLKLSNP